MDILVVLCIIVVILQFTYLVVKEIVTVKERERLTNKIMAREFVDYANAELLKLMAEKKKKTVPEDPNNGQIPL